MNLSREHGRLMRLASAAALATALILVAAKAIAWWLSGSVSLLAGLTDSLLDGAASLVNLIAVHYALQPADENHRYGHGKAEALAGLGQAVFIAISAVLVGIRGFERLQEPQPVEATGVGVAVILLSLAMTFGLLLFQRHVVKVTGSTAIRADSLHYASDLLLNASILAALLLAAWGWQRADALFGIGIALYILWSALGIVRESASVLMDEELPLETSERMLQLAQNVPGVLGAHDLRTRMSGTHWFVQLHLDLPASLTLQQAHDLCEAAELAIRAEFPRAEVLVHADPQH
ncbi:Cation-efflux pump FieF [Pseudomonas sp. OF001]|jgi:cation diffusion facilitator family transporter|uniref:cation diffusion facilitator family transporter n=1 Tax=unclassified Pseudomonas TaxID=196821 RepID=UPI0010A642BB|nr:MULTISPECIES: cation diffusion facilitator family transporter [unclassified Pseudomonas]THG71384.1 cation diffusion facilitator family transporter [Pseudomonas sp. A-1]CAD5379843.1 Cation-efflux pump FieF [Pseudomonas sp. OF001]